MYLSRLALKADCPEVQARLRDAHRMHQLVMSGFGEGGNRALHQVLYRLEQRGTEAVVLVQSQEPPRWEGLRREWLLGSGAGNPALRSLDESWSQLQPGQPLLFRLRANVTRKLCASDKRNGKRVPLHGREAWVSWLSRKAFDGGVELVADKELPLLARASTIEGSRDSARLTFAAIEFSGGLRVARPDDFRRMLRAGVGPGKAYGFGMLVLSTGGMH